MSKQPHKWQKEIIAWANGETIQRRHEGLPDWRDTKNPSWQEDVEYRIKPKTILINGFEVPKPARELKHGQAYYSPVLGYTGLTVLDGFNSGSKSDKHRLENGLCHLTEEAAIAHAKALLSFTNGGNTHE